MCEFNVFLEGEKVFEDVVFCRADSSQVLLKDILGQSKQLPNCRIVEVNVAAEKLVLELV